MKQYPSIRSKSLPDIAEFCTVVEKLRNEDVREISNLNNRLVQGRLRIDRTVPADSDDIQQPDRLGDIVRTASFEYVVIADGTSLKWRRVALEEF